MAKMERHPGGRTCRQTAIRVILMVVAVIAAVLLAVIRP